MMGKEKNSVPPKNISCEKEKNHRKRKIKLSVFLPPMPKDRAPIADKPPASLDAWISLPIPPFLLRSTRAVK